jgi:hypothetical protein
MLTDHYYHRIIRKVTTVFGTLFKNIYVKHYDKYGVEITRQKVPLEFSAKEKFFNLLHSDPSANMDVARSYPRIAFNFEGIVPDFERKLNNNHKNATYSIKNGQPSIRYQATPVPYVFHYTVAIAARSTEDGAQIIEQILPYFTPTYSIKMNVIPEIDEEIDLMITLQSVNYSLDYEGDFESTRNIEWTLDFTVKGAFYGPITEIGPIKRAETSLKVNWFSIGDILEVQTHNVTRNFRDDEVIYQGNTYNDATAKGRYIRTYSSNNVANTASLEIQLLEGKFKANTEIVGSVSKTRQFLYSIDNYEATTEKVIVAVDPPTANVDDYGYSISIVNMHGDN